MNTGKRKSISFVAALSAFVFASVLQPSAYAETVKIDFDDGGGDGSMSSVSGVITDGGSSGDGEVAACDECGDGYRYRYYRYRLPKSKFTRPGYKFGGWLIHDPCRDLYYKDVFQQFNGRGYYGPFPKDDWYYVICNIRMMPYWIREAAYTVRLHRNNSANDGATAGRNFVINERSQLPTISSLGWSRPGYDFKGWGFYTTSSYASYSDGEWVYNLSASDGAVVHLYAIWEVRLSYTVQLHRNNSETDGATASRSFIQDVARNLPTIRELGWSRPGYTFAGWATYADASYTSYSDGERVINLGWYDGQVVHLYAVWRANARYTIRLHRNNNGTDNATAVRSMLVGVGRYLPAIGDLGWSRPGYAFVGWGLSANDGSPDYEDEAYAYNLANVDGAEVHLYAIWRSNGSYTVRLHRNSGWDDSATAGRRFQIGVGRRLPTIAELGWSRQAYDFAGWARSQYTYYAEYRDGELVSGLSSSDGDEVHLYAVWRAKPSYEVRLYRNNSYNDGATALRTMVIDVSRNLPTMADLGWTRAGFHFLGWSTSYWSSLISYTDGQQVVNLADSDGAVVNLYAVWEENARYNVRLHRNNNSEDGATAVRSMVVGAWRNLPSISELGWSRAGYTFVGWGTYVRDTSADYSDGQRVIDLAHTDGAEVHLYAIWRINVVNYTIRLHRNNSASDEAVANRACVTGRARQLPTIDALGWSREGYAFVGWGTYASDGTANYSDGQTVQNLTTRADDVVHLYAIWRSTVVTYTVRLHRNCSATDGATANRAFTVGKSRTLPTIAELGWNRPGYSFAGWGTSAGDASADYTDGQRVGGLASAQGAVVHLYAIWRSTAKYTVRLHRNYSANDGAAANRAFTVGKNRALPTIAELGWNRSGYSFAGWATDQTSHFTRYYDGQQVRDLSTSDGAVVNLYAVWY